MSNNGRKTIIFISNEASLYGATKILFHVINYFHAMKKYDLLLVCPTDGPMRRSLDRSGVSTLIPACLKKYYDHVSFPARFHVQIFRRIYDNLVLFRYFFRLFRRQTNLVVYANTSVVRYVALPAVLAGAKLVWHVHEYFDNPIKQKFHSLLINLCSDKIVANSHAVVSHFQIFKNSASKIFHFHFYQDMGLPDNGLNKADNSPAYDLLFAGRISIAKGVLDLLAAIQQVVQQGLELKALIIGTFVPQDKDKILGFVDKNKLRENVVFHDFDPDIRKHILNARAVVLPSYRESLGLILVEAILLGKPVIGTRVGDIPIIIDDNENGFLIQPGDVEQLTHAITRLLDEEQYRHFVKRAHEKRSQLVADMNGMARLEEMVWQLC